VHLVDVPHSEASHGGRRHEARVGVDDRTDQGTEDLEALVLAALDNERCWPCRDRHGPRCVGHAKQHRLGRYATVWIGLTRHSHLPGQPGLSLSAEHLLDGREQPGIEPEFGRRVSHLDSDELQRGVGENLMNERCSQRLRHTLLIDRL